MPVAHAKYLSITGNIVVPFIVEAKAAAAGSAFFEFYKPHPVSQGKDRLQGNVVQYVPGFFAVELIDYFHQLGLPDECGSRID